MMKKLICGVALTAGFGMAFAQGEQASTFKLTVENHCTGELSVMNDTGSECIAQPLAVPVSKTKDLELPIMGKDNQSCRYHIVLKSSNKQLLPITYDKDKPVQQAAFMMKKNEEGVSSCTYHPAMTVSN